MATGTGKTRTAIALVDLLQRCNWAIRVLFLADRVSLVKQATNAFKAHLPESSPVNLVTEKETVARVYTCTYPTMMGMIDETKDGAARFGVGHFDLVIIDEAHRSVYQRYREIFRYFDSLLVGLTATPRDQVDRNTYHLFDLEQGVPTDAYELDQAVKDGFLVPPKASIVDLRFPREGISYEQLSDEEKAEWESLDWGDEPGEPAPDTVHASAVNRWLFNTDTVDKVLETLMRDGIKVEQGDRLGKTIVFARNHDHAIFIEERFNHHYPQYKGSFARVIDNKAKYAQSLIEDFCIKAKEPHIAISVDMMDTGIDVPEVVNLVFFKPVYSRIKFWQMIGRGTRLCPDLFGPGQDKEDFRIFDFCFNFDFFQENPNGIEGSGGEALGTKLFRHRVQLASTLQAKTDLEPSGSLASKVIDLLHAEVQGMHPDNFLVRPHLRYVDRYRERDAWNGISEPDALEVVQHLAGLPSQVEDDDVEAKLFDLRLLRMQLAKVEDDPAQYEKDRKTVVLIAEALQEKDNVPAVREHLDLIRNLQEVEYWEGMDLLQLEHIRECLRGLIQLLDKGKRKTVYTHFQDQVVSMREQAVVEAPSMTGAQYQQKVQAYLRDHQDHIAVQRLRQNQPLTLTDLQSLEEALTEIGNGEGQQLLKDMLVQSDAPSLAWFVRSLVGMDRQAAHQAFSQFLSDRSLTPRQIRFIELIVDQLTARGVIEPSALYESPFTDLDTGGPESVFEGKDEVVDGIFGTLQKVSEMLKRAE
jgi:type I restriction enzyme R subunit